MVKAYRADDRLIHGQVQTKWIAEYQINRVIIIDDNVEKDPITLQILKIAKPPSIDLVVCGEERAMALLEKDNTQQNARTFVIFKTIATAWRLCQKGLKIPRLIVGPCSSKAGAVQVSKNTYFTPEEREAANGLVQGAPRWRSSCCPGRAKPSGPPALERRRQKPAAWGQRADGACTKEE